MHHQPLQDLRMNKAIQQVHYKTDPTQCEQDPSEVIVSINSELSPPQHSDFATDCNLTR